MSYSALIIRPSSLGDIVHALPIVHDLARHRPGISIDWVAEEAFVPLVSLNRGVRRVVSLALRRWRHGAFSRSTWREFGAFRRALQLERYDVVIDLQEQIKGALVAWLARGPAHGPDRASIREPIATVMYRHVHRIDPRAHLIDRCRQLAGKALGYEPLGAPRFDLTVPRVDLPRAPYAVCVHGTSRVDKLWPEAHWRELIDALARMGLSVVIPWGSEDEARRSERLAGASPNAHVMPRRGLPELASVLAHAKLVYGVDTGLTHLAAAVGTPTVSLFTATDPRLAGVERAGLRTRDLGDVGTVPSVRQALAAANELGSASAVDDGEE